MPLVLMCGIPGSGKTQRSLQLAQYLKNKHNANVCVVNEQYLGIDKNMGYQSKYDWQVGAEDEKMTRSKIKFQVEKKLIGDTVVIVDSMNYIKGYRYQMYCIAREQKTTYCVIFCNTQPNKCRQFNQMNINKFSDNLQEDLSKRMEKPQLKSTFDWQIDRWDNPLIERREDEGTPLAEIADLLLFQEKKSKDPVSTKQQQKLSQNYLIQLDTLMQQINQQVLTGKIKLVNNWSAVQLKKLKKNFINIAKEKPQNLKILKKGYLDFITEADKRK